MGSGLDAEIEVKLRSCVVFQEHIKLSPNANLHPWEWQGKPWDRVHIDYAGPLEGKTTPVVVDVHSKYIDGDAHVMTSSKSAATPIKLRQPLLRTDCPVPWFRTMELYSQVN